MDCDRPLSTANVVDDASESQQLPSTEPVLVDEPISQEVEDNRPLEVRLVDKVKIP